MGFSFISSDYLKAIFIHLTGCGNAVAAQLSASWKEADRRLQRASFHGQSECPSLTHLVDYGLETDSALQSPGGGHATYYKAPLSCPASGYFNYSPRGERLSFNSITRI